MAKLITAVGYLRMSTDKQETSPEQQRAEIEKYAAQHGYQVMRWYQDLGISGDRTDKRLQFQQMIADAADGRFKAILCWDQDRFGRFDSLESGYWIHPLRGQGVQLVTCTDGPVDWNSFAGRMLYGMKQEGKHQYLVDLSNNVTRRMNQLAQQGLWISGAPPVGYAVDADKRLILGKPEDVEFIKRLFKQFLSGLSLRQLAEWAKGQGYLSSRGKPWSVMGVRDLLKKSIYTGTYTYGRTQFSKYQGKAGTGRNRPQQEWITIPNNHPAIVTQQQFDTVQLQLKARTKQTAPATKGPGFALSGLLHCGCCNATMLGETDRNGRCYTCGTYKRRPGDCERYSVKEPEVLQEVLKQVRLKMFRPSILSRVRKELERQVKQAVDVVDSRQKQIENLDRKIEAAELRLLDVSRDMIPRVEQQLRQLERQRQDLLAHSMPTESQTRYADTNVQQRIDTALAWFRNLEKLATIQYNPRKVKHLLGQFIEGIDLQMVRTQWKQSETKKQTTIVGGSIRFNFCKLAHSGWALRTSFQTDTPQGLCYSIRWGKAA